MPGPPGSEPGGTQEKRVAPDPLDEELELLDELLDEELELLAEEDEELDELLLEELEELLELLDEDELDESPESPAGGAPPPEESSLLAGGFSCPSAESFSVISVLHPNNAPRISAIATSRTFFIIPPPISLAEVKQITYPARYRSTGPDHIEQVAREKPLF